MEQQYTIDIDFFEIINQMKLANDCLIKTNNDQLDKDHEEYKHKLIEFANKKNNQELNNLVNSVMLLEKSHTQINRNFSVDFLIMKFSDNFFFCYEYETNTCFKKKKIIINDKSMIVRIFIDDELFECYDKLQFKTIDYGLFKEFIFFMATGRHDRF